jgi:hypothetical protein
MVMVVPFCFGTPSRKRFKKDRLWYSEQFQVDGSSCCPIEEEQYAVNIELGC